MPAFQTYEWLCFESKYNDPNSCAAAASNEDEEDIPF